MIDLIVFRFAGDKEGEEIFDPLLSDVSAAIQRGKFEIDFNTPTIPTALEIEYTATMRQGNQIAAIDSRTGGVVYGVVKDFSHVIDGPVIFTRVNMEVPQ